MVHLGFFNKKTNIQKVNNLFLSAPWLHIRGGGVQLHSFLTSVPDGSKRQISRPGQFTPRNEPQVHTEWEAVWASEPVGAICRRGTSIVPACIRSPNRTLYQLRYRYY